jgi:hypothetical protein
VQLARTQADLFCNNIGWKSDVEFVWTDKARVFGVFGQFEPVNFFIRIEAKYPQIICRSI